MSSNNLPTQLTSFIGREREIAEARKLLESTHLLTLTGAGGSGKTRLALAVAEGLLDGYPDGVWLVELASLSDAALIPQAIASVLGVREAPGRPLMETLAAYLKSKRLLLLLDNCEHLIDPCAQLAYTLLLACPNLRILATSREPLHIAGEVTWLVPLLALPDLQGLPPLEEMIEIAAVRLFVERARNIMPAFTLNQQNAFSIAQICCWLGGIPLAIELAAVRVKVLSPEQIASRLDDVFQLLVSSDRTAPSRHQTLQATLDWSFNLLPEKERALFCRMAVFAGGITLEAVETVCADDDESWTGDQSSSRLSAFGIHREEILDLLAQLLDKSLVVVDSESEHGRRYRLLEPVRQYSLKKLQTSGEEVLLRDRHLTWFLGLAEQAESEILGPEPKFWVGRLEQEYPNLRAALDWSLSMAHRAPLGFRLTGALCQFWQLRGYFSEGLEWLKLALSSGSGVNDHLRARAFHNVGFLAIHIGDIELAMRSHMQALELWKELGDRNWVAMQKGFLGLVARSAGDFEGASRLGEESLAMHRENRDSWGASIALFLLGDLAYVHGDYLKARADLEESLALCRESNNILAIARRLTRLGQITLALGEQGRAASLFEESLRLSREAGDYWGIAMAMAGIAGMARVRGQVDRAACLLGATHTLLETFGTHLWPVDQMEYDRNISAAKAMLGEDAFETVWREGIMLGAGGPDQAIQFALTASDQIRTEPVHLKPGPGQPPLSPLQVAKREFSGLTRREREVAALIAQGMSNSEIASALFVGLRTVEAHVTHILNKLGFSSRTQIAGWAVDKGLASSPRSLEDQMQ